MYKQLMCIAAAAELETKVAELHGFIPQVSDVSSCQEQEQKMLQQIAQYAKNKFVGKAFVQVIISIIMLFFNYNSSYDICNHFMKKGPNNSDCD